MQGTGEEESRMKARIAPRITTEGRTKLETVIPLSTPYLVFLDPSDKCNAGCGWCPTGNGEARKWKKAKVIDWFLYTKIIEDLATMPEPVKTLRLYKDGEPLLNPRFPAMVSYAKDTGRFGQVDTTTNGLLLNDFTINKLWAAGLDMIVVSVPSEYNREYVGKIKLLYRAAQFFNALNSDGRREVVVKLIGDGLGQTRKNQFMKDFEDICDRIFIEYLAPCWPDFQLEGVGKVGIYGQPIKEVQVCPYVFYSLSINSDGTVSKCFLDWRHDMVIGDLKKERFVDIWNGSKLEKVRKSMLRGERAAMKHCCDCGQLEYGMPDDIDEYAEKLLGRLK
jgi:radical SAM protein with 4Fe4S-binding SPASM domain